MQPYLEKLSLRLSDDLGDVATSGYTADGETIEAIQRESAINRAVKSLYDTELDIELAKVNNDLNKAAESMMSRFMNYREIITITRTSIDPPAKIWTKDEKIRKMLTVTVNATNPEITGKIAKPLKDWQYHQASTNQYSNFKSTTSKPHFYEFEKTFSLELGKGSTGADNVISEGTLELVCLTQPMYTAFDTTGDDINAPGTWEDSIIELAKAIVLGNHQQ